MQSSSQEILSTTFLEIVEQLTFMFGEPTPKAEMEDLDKEFTLAKMSFTGDLTGVLSVAVPTEITAEITANILGLDPEDIEPETMMVDALAEMLNVVCGHVIMALVGTDANFRLDAPETGVVDDALRTEMLASDDYTGFVLDESPVFLGLTLES